MKILSPKQYVAEVLKMHKQEAIKENSVKIKEEKQEKEAEEEKSDLHKEMLERAALPSQYNKFMESVKEEFVSECVYSVFNESLTIFDRINPKQEFVKKALVKNFVQDMGASKLLLKFKNKNALLSEFALICDKAITAVAETTTAYNKNSWTVDKDIKDRFTDDLKNCNSKEAIIAITDRVADAETEFVNDNIRKKMEIDDILQAKKEKLDAIENKPEEVKESVAASYDRRIKAIKNRYTTSIYQTIAESMTKNALKDESLKSIYVKEGNLDMKTLLEDSGILYTFLETVFTTEMADASYIKEFINNI